MNRIYFDKLSDVRVSSEYNEALVRECIKSNPVLKPSEFPLMSETIYKGVRIIIGIIDIKPSIESYTLNWTIHGAVLPTPYFDSEKDKWYIDLPDLEVEAKK